MFRALPSAYDNFLSTVFLAKQSLATTDSRRVMTNTITPSLLALKPKLVRRYQNVLVMRHGDRLDNSDPSWIATAPRPWDPPLTPVGRTRARMAGANIGTQLGFPIHRIVVSPFLRCLETANEVIYGFCGAEDGILKRTGNRVANNTDSSKVKVSIEYGLCEMFNGVAIRHPPPEPENGEWGFNRAKLEMRLPQQILDHDAHRVYDELPQWQEAKADAASRFTQVIKELADKYPLQNLLFVTHGEGVCVAVTAYSDGIKMKKTQYCSYAKLRRPIYEDNGASAGEFELENVVGGPEISLD